MLAPDRASRLNAQALLAELINDRQTQSRMPTPDSVQSPQTADARYSDIFVALFL
jgi:hypothetical protein